ncbi:MarR family transcriptional regulator [Bordetella trematum]|uniref:MarR family winged helix-turn-helix transcriptional regulator n=1 Tax=Bordetella trematum TaxID=123899 RepID=UPI000470CB3C|nr:MarR family transcriptional regulator [Bordetella trematum]AUL46989.1 MarR family transcriptional regulator [Bordetella trematum]AZR93790.1 MarR family transcriptional regulator [Bordetella trematum]
MVEQKYRALLQQAERQEQDGLDDMRLCLQTLSLAAAIDRDCAARLAVHGLSEGRYILLFLLEAAPDGLAPHALASQAGVSRATVTGLLDGLQADALIERQADPRDRRARRVVLTRAGRQLARQVFAEHNAWMAGLFKHLDAAERRQLTRLLTKARQGLPSP